MVHVLAGEHERRPAAVLARAQEPLGLAEAACRREEEREGSVGRRLVEDPRRERHRDPPRPGGSNIDVVVAGPHRRDHAELGRAADRVSGQGVRRERVDHVGVRDHARDLVGGRDRRLGGADLDVTARPQERERVLRNRSRHDDLHGAREA